MVDAQKFAAELQKRATMELIVRQHHATAAAELSEAFAALQAELETVKGENVRLQNEWDNCDEMLQACRAEAKLAGGEAEQTAILYSAEIGIADDKPKVIGRFPLSALTHPAPTHEDGSGEAERDVFAERERQKSSEGWTVEHDDTHSDGEMARAAGIYALIAGSGPTTYRNAREGYTLNDTFQDVMEHCWPWNKDWFKPTDRRRDLVKAGALILAEIERLDRAASRVKDTGGSDGR